MLKKIVAVLGSVLSGLFGQMNWTAPAWMNQLQQRAVASPRRFLATLFMLLLLGGSAWYAYRWYQHLPKPVLVMAELTAPVISPVDQVSVINPLTIDFGVLKGTEWQLSSVAPLDKVGRAVEQGIVMSPAIAGEWFWESDSRLVFTPTTDWPAGQEYTITFGKDVFAPSSKMASYTETFSTLPFQANIASFKFYQDPINPGLRQAIATINFNYPIDAASLDDRISLRLEALKNGEQSLAASTYHYTVTFDQTKRIAYLHSEALTLPVVPRYLELALASGLKAMNGASKTTEPVKATVLIPDAATLFRVDHLTASIVRNQQDQPEQVLMLETSLGVKESELAKSMHVYLLPKDYPATSSSEVKTDYVWQQPGEVTERVLALAKPVDIQAIPSDRDYSPLHSYRLHLASPAYLYIKIDKGVRAFGDVILANDYVAVVKVPEYPQEITFLHKGALLALGTEEKLSVLVRGLSSVKFDMARVLPDDVNHLITQTYGDFSHPEFINPNFTQENISEIFSQVQTFAATEPGKEQYTALDLSKYVSTKANANGPHGLFLLQAQGWDAEKKIPLDVKTNRLILITDLGLIVKDNIDGTHDMFVQSITKGAPVANATVSILGKNGVAVLVRQTDASGRASFPNLSEFTYDREPTVYVVRLGNDVSFIPYLRADRQLNYSRFDIGGVENPSAANPSALTAYVFSDRGIYRPGDTAHLGMIVKQPYAMPAVAGLPLELIVTDPRGTTVLDQKIALNSEGLLTLDYVTQLSSSTGQYVVSLYIVKDNQASSLIGSMNFNVAEFLPDRMRMNARLSTEQVQGWLSPSALQAEIGLWNLYGAPAVDHRVTGKLLLSPQAVTFKQYPDFTFTDPLVDPNKPTKVFSEALTEARTDKQGHAQFDLKLDRFERATYQLTVFTEGFESEGGRSVTAQTTALVSPLDYLVGYKPDGDLNYIKQNDVRLVRLIAINPQLKQLALSDMQMQLYRLQPVTSLIKKQDGTYEYQSIVQSKQVSATSFAIASQGINYTLPTDQIGDFMLMIVDKQGVPLTQFKFSVVGNLQQAMPKNAELSAKLSKATFAPGEEIEVQIVAPYTGSGLITIERDKVYAFRWFKADTTASIQKIKIPADFQGNGYINIAYVRDINSDEIYTSPLSYSVVPFAVTHEQHALHIDLKAPELAKPGQPLMMSYQADKPGKAIIFAVDEGILQVTKYQTPDPLQFFFQKYALGVSTQQIVDQILPKFMVAREMSTVGGDASEAMMMKNLNPFKRQTDLPVVYWSGIVDVDSTPRVLTYQVPDYFNGTLRIMAIAVAAEAVGSATRTAEVRGNFIINANVPTFVAPGDEFEVSASIANNVTDSGQYGSIDVSLHTTDQLEVIGSSTTSLSIPEGEERAVRFKLKARAALGSATVNWLVAMDGKTSKLDSTLSVRPAMAYTTSVTAGFSSDETKTLTLDHDFYTAFRRVNVAVSSSPLILLFGLNHYLTDYPYGCTEQLTSKAMPLLAMAKDPRFAKDLNKLAEKVQQLIQLIGQRQMSSGAFSYWPEVSATSSNDFATIYAMHFLTEAKAQGFSVPMDMLSAGVNYLKDYAMQEAATLEDARLKAYAIYVLTRNEIVTTNYLTHLQLALKANKAMAWQNDITSVYLAASYQLLKSNIQAAEMINAYHPKEQTDVEDNFYNPSTANAQYLYVMAKHFPELLPSLGEGLLSNLVASMNQDSMSTVFSGYASLALSAYGEANSAVNPVVIGVNALDAQDQATALTTSNVLYQQIDLGEYAKKLQFTNLAKLGYFYQVVQAGFDKNQPKSTFSNGIEISRDFRNADNTVVKGVKLGDEITVHIRLRSLEKPYVNNVAVSDLLPGGFEVVRDSVKADGMDYADIREDRVVFFGSAQTESKEIVYRIKATNKGQYTVPPIAAASMYYPMISAMGVGSTMLVN